MRLALAALAGCAGSVEGDVSGPRRLVDVVSAPEDTGEGFRDVGRAVNGVRGAGSGEGSLDVYTIGTELVLGAGADPVLDGDGPELAVFENPFAVAGGGVFVEACVVEVTPDGVDWAAFPHALAGDPWDGASWVGFAGVSPVWLNEDDLRLDPFSDAAGGDRFDLADLDPADDVAAAVLADGFVAVRLTPAEAWPDVEGEPYPALPSANGPDIDGVYVR